MGYRQKINLAHAWWVNDKENSSYNIDAWMRLKTHLLPQSRSRGCWRPDPCPHTLKWNFLKIQISKIWIFCFVQESIVDRNSKYHFCLINWNTHTHTHAHTNRENKDCLVTILGIMDLIQWISCTTHRLTLEPMVFQILYNHHCIYKYTHKCMHTKTITQCVCVCVHACVYINIVVVIYSLEENRY